MRTVAAPSSTGCRCMSQNDTNAARYFVRFENEKRANLRPNDVVRVSRFDKTGKVVRVDVRKQTVTVSVGLGQWEIPFEEIYPT